MEALLKGQVAVVTGASSGLGAHFAKLLARNGASVALAARRVDRLQALVDEITKGGGRAIALELDVADPHAIGPALDAVEAKLGPISILVNNAGVGAPGAALKLSIEDWDNTFNVNVRGVFVAAREAARRMIASGVAARGDARIVNIASIATFTVMDRLSAYSASKAAVGMLTKGLAREWAQEGISVNAICPGYVGTELTEAFFSTEAGEKKIQTLPRRRLLKVEDMDAPLLMLAGPAAHGITGTLVTVDDGHSLVGA